MLSFLRYQGLGVIRENDIEEVIRNPQSGNLSLAGGWDNFKRDMEERMRNGSGCQCDPIQDPPGVGGEYPLIPPRPGEPPLTAASPIILDLNNDGVKTRDIEDGAYFDYDSNRFATKSDWVSPEDALLVRDINGNEQIDDGGELFGNNTELANGNKAANGFAALAEFDSNDDGVVDQNDERWSELKLWQDSNGDGKVDDGELLTLEEAGVSGLRACCRIQLESESLFA